MADQNEQIQNSPVEVYERKDTVIGQPQSANRDPHDGSVLVHEIVVHTDKRILDPNHPLAVQVPEGIGASASENVVGLAESLRAGTAEDQFRRGYESDSDKESAPPAASDSKGSTQVSADKLKDSPASGADSAPASKS